MIRKLYDWVFQLAAHKSANWALAIVSFVESSVFPIPPDVLLIPMVLAKRHKWIFYAALCTVASVAGAYLGYFIGAVLYETIGEPVLAFYGKADSFEKVSAWYNEWGGWGVLFAAITPFPYKVLTIFSGATGLDLVTFTLVSIVGRGLRFFLVSWLLQAYGLPVREFIEKRLGLMFTIGMILLIGGFAAVKLVF
ncbi:MAG: DedA family protein [Rhizobiaceae bacterium]|jgi:membrane protein YqaA with SNARE-associated domain|nr:DedA family protein [Rhizobiaceae bacterium]